MPRTSVGGRAAARGAVVRTVLHPPPGLDNEPRPRRNGLCGLGSPAIAHDNRVLNATRALTCRSRAAVVPSRDTIRAKGETAPGTQADVLGPRWTRRASIARLAWFMFLPALQRPASVDMTGE